MWLEWVDIWIPRSSNPHIYSFCSFCDQISHCLLFNLVAVSILLSSKLGLDAGSPGSSGSSGSGSSALSPPEMLFRTWGGGQGGHCTQRTCPRGVGADCINLTVRPESSKNTHPTHLLNKNFPPTSLTTWRGETSSETLYGYMVYSSKPKPK